MTVQLINIIREKRERNLYLNSFEFLIRKLIELFNYLTNFQRIQINRAT